VLGSRAAPALVLPEVVDRGDLAPDAYDERDGAARATSALRRRVGVRSGLTDAGPLALAGFIANSANVVVTVLLARLLSTRGYGALAQLTSLFLIVSVPGTAVVVGVVRRVTALATSGRGASVRDWAHRNHMRVTVAVAVLAIAVFSARGPIAHMLSIPTPLGVFAMVVAGSVWVLLSLDRGLLQAKRRYRVLSVNLLVEGGARTAAVLCLVGAGMGVAGAAWGFLFAEVVTALHARLVADRSWARGPAGPGSLRATVRARWMHLNRGLSLAEPPGGTHRKERRRLLLDLSGALVAMALLAYLQNVDVIVLGREAPHATGTYAAISVVSKALVFGALALGWYLLPEAAIEWHRGGHALRQLGVTLLILAVPSFTLLLAALAFPRWLLSFVFSARYTGAHAALWLLVLAMIFLSTTVVLTTYLLAAGQRWIGALLVVGAVVATLALVAAHGAPHPTAATDLVVQALLAVSTVVVFVRIHVRRIRRDTADGPVG
jgi:O-antigen/teichoic acid export membrane protein